MPFANALGTAGHAESWLMIGEKPSGTNGYHQYDPKLITLKKIKELEGATTMDLNKITMANKDSFRREQGYQDMHFMNTERLQVYLRWMSAKKATFYSFISQFIRASTMGRGKVRRRD